MSSPNLPERRLDRAAMERVLARAMELHVRTDASSDDGDALSEARVLEIAREVGIAPDAVRQAIAEERARAPLDAARAERGGILGDPMVSAARVVRGSPSDVLGRLEAMLTRDETLTVIRRFPDRLVFEPRRGVIDAVARSVDFGGKGYYLSRAHEVVVSVGAVDGQRVHAAIAADLRPARSRRLATPIALAAIGALAGAPLMVLTLYPWLAIIPPLALGWLGWVIARTSWRALRRQAEVAVERLLDRLEYPDKPSAAQQLIDGIARTLGPLK